MKKIYRKPVALTIDVTTEEMIAQSIGVNGNTSADPNYEGGGDAKEIYFDDDEEEALW